MRARLAPGTRLGSFVIQRLLARGGTGDVYVARRDGDPVDLALKVLVDLTPADRERCAREASIAASLAHPRIVRLLDHEAVAPDVALLAFELLRGETLAQRIARAPLPLDAALTVVDQVLAGLGEAHARGVVHRDVKPANIFLCDGDGIDARLLDFGLARALTGRRVTTTGHLLGTPGYMSPEVLHGGAADASADLWAVGVTLFEALTGALPFEGESSLSSMFQIAFGQARALDAVWPEAPPALVAVCDRALARDPSARFANALALQAALRAAAAVSREAAAAPPPATLAVENRLVTLLMARGDARYLYPLASAAGARAATLDDRVAALFGHDRWAGDEPERAMHLARALQRMTAAVAIVTDHAVLRGAAMPEELVARAAALLPARGLALDAASERLLRTARDVPRDDVADAPRPAFVGRALERDLLLDAVRGARSAALPRAVLILGGRGLGRSRLLEEAQRALHREAPGALLLRARCESTRRDVSFAAVQDALGDNVHPGLAAMLQAASRGDPQASFDRVRADLDALFARLTEAGPLVLAFDDAQWLDPASRGVLRSVLDASTLPVTLWCFADPDARGALQALVADTTTRALAPLAPDEAARLVRALRPDADDVDAIVARAAGSPMVLEALASQPTGAPLPLTIESALRASLDRLEPAERDFVLRASIFGDPVPVEGVRALGGADCSVALRRSGWVASRPRSRYAGSAEVEFRSPWVPEVARSVWPDAERRALHAAAARWLAERRDAVPDEVAAQWDLADDAGRAAVAWAEATVQASRHGAAEAAAAHCLRVLARTELPALQWRALAARDDVLQMSGDRALQRGGLDAMAALARRLDDGARAEVAWRLIHHARMTGDEALAAAQRKTIEALAGGEGVDRWACAAATELALLYADRGRLAEARAQADAAVSLAGPLASEWQRARAAHALAYVMVEAGAGLDDAVARYADAAADYERAGDLRREAIAHVNRGAALAALGRLGEALDSLDVAIERARAVGNHRAAAVALENRGAVRRMLGDHREARDDLAEALARGRRLGHFVLVEVASVELVYLALAAGGDDAGLAARADELRARLDGCAGLAHVAAVTAAVLRARHRLGAPDAEVARRARALGAHAELPDTARAELRAALWVADGGLDADADEFAAAVAAIEGAAVGPEDAAIRRRAVLRRFAVPVALCARVDGSD